LGLFLCFMLFLLLLLVLPLILINLHGCNDAGCSCGFCIILCVTLLCCCCFSCFKISYGSFRAIFARFARIILKTVDRITQVFRAICAPTFKNCCPPELRIGFSFSTKKSPPLNNAPNTEKIICTTKSSLFSPKSYCLLKFHLQ
jgi:hypothetical protein